MMPAQHSFNALLSIMFPAFTLLIQLAALAAFAACNMLV